MAAPAPFGRRELEQDANQLLALDHFRVPVLDRRELGKRPRKARDRPPCEQRMPYDRFRERQRKLRVHPAHHRERQLTVGAARRDGLDDLVSFFVSYKLDDDDFDRDGGPGRVAQLEGELVVGGSLRRLRKLNRDMGASRDSDLSRLSLKKATVKSPICRLPTRSLHNLLHTCSGGTRLSGMQRSRRARLVDYSRV